MVKTAWLAPEPAWFIKPQSTMGTIPLTALLTLDSASPSRLATWRTSSGENAALTASSKLGMQRKLECTGIDFDQTYLKQNNYAKNLYSIEHR
ncbi:hypothetical protein KCG47_19960 [Microvirga sp. SRT04]|nr:hypothetical protein [Microvirga sp. SRT04]